MGVVFPQSGRGFKNFARASRATVLLEPSLRKSWIRHCHNKDPHRGGELLDQFIIKILDSNTYVNLVQATPKVNSR